MTESELNSAPIIVIGGGISGLACAFQLKQRGVPVLLLEQSEIFGGVVQTVQRDGFLFENGPQSFTLTPELDGLIGATGLSGELVKAAPRLPRYIYTGGKLVAAPLSPFSLVTTPLLDARTKWNLFTEPLRTTKPPSPDESIAAFARRKFGNSLLENLVGPIVSGVYAGDPEQLSLRSAFPKIHEWESRSGSVVRGAAKQIFRSKKPKDGKKKRGLCSLNRGVGSLMQALGAQLGTSARLGVTVGAVRLNTSGERVHFDVCCSRGGTNETFATRSVVCAADPASAGPMLAPASLQFEKSLAKIPYASVAVVSLGYRREAIGRALDGFGFLVPRKEGLRLLGCVWNSSLFAGRAPEGHVLLTCFAGGATDPELCTWSEERIANVIHEELAGVLGIREAPSARHLNIYPRALPQYNLAHFGRMTELKWTCDATGGIFLVGNYLEGPSLGTCVSRSFRVADEVAEFFRRSR
jgi:oxygen-dependent protoporphyrinogen oxidase